MSVCNSGKSRPKKLAVLLACAMLFQGCTTSPTSGRAQFNLLPAPFEASVSDLRFSVKTLLSTGGATCQEDNGPCSSSEEAESLARRIAPIAERLGAVAVQISPELATRVPRVEVFVIPNDTPSVVSSAGGKLAVSSSLSRLDLSDTDLALALAREFGRLAAAHHRESTSAGIAVSLVAGSPLVGAYLATSILADLLFPMGTLLKLGISVLGSMGTEQMVESSQQDEADEFAGKLMLAAGYDLSLLAEPRMEAPGSAIKLGWLPGYLASRVRVAAMLPPLPAAAGTVAAQKAPKEAEEALPRAAPEFAATPISSPSSRD